MKEVINIHVGQGGVQIANAVWELYCAEHGIEPNGKIREDVNDTTFTTFFSETQNRQHVPRAVFVDLEPSVLDEIRTGIYRGLYHPDQLINGYEDAANNFARGHYTLGKSLIGPVMEKVRRLVDSCETLQGFFITHTFGGGAGSGFTALLLEKLAIEYSKMTKIQSAIIPGPHLSTAIVEPYNLILNTHTTIEMSDICMMQDNESAYGIFTSSLDIMKPNFININRLLAQVMSSLTVSLRFESSLNYDLNQMETNLVPYPRIHFPIVNHAPILSRDRAMHEHLSARILTRAVFDQSSQLVRCDCKRGRYMACCLQYRGDVSPKEVGSSVNALKTSPEISFVDWCPTGFKLGVNLQSPTYIPESGMADTGRNVTMMSNTTAISQAFANLCCKFDLMFAKRCFIHWFVGEGMEEGEFSEAREDLAGLMQDYIDLGGVPPDAEDVKKSNSNSASINNVADTYKSPPMSSGEDPPYNVNKIPEIKSSSSKKGKKPDENKMYNNSDSE